MKEKLIEILKSNPEVKKDMEELKFGCKIKYRDWLFDVIIKHDTDWNRYTFSDTIWHQVDNNPITIIWTLSERHLRMYCKSHQIIIDFTWLIQYLPEWSKEWEFYQTICQLDNTKDFDNQSSEVYEKIVEFINQVK